MRWRCGCGKFPGNIHELNKRCQNCGDVYALKISLAVSNRRSELLFTLVTALMIGFAALIALNIGCFRSHLYIRPIFVISSLERPSRCPICCVLPFLYLFHTIKWNWTIYKENAFYAHIWMSAIWFSCFFSKVLLKNHRTSFNVCIPFILPMNASKHITPILPHRFFFSKEFWNFYFLSEKRKWQSFVYYNKLTTTIIFKRILYIWHQFNISIWYYYTSNLNP